jgi:hypothetical membrane protein
MTFIRMILGAALLLCGIVAPIVIGTLTPGYDPRADFLSELGQTGAPYANAMNLGAFLPAGVFWALGAGLIWRSLPKGALGAAGAALLLANALSYVGAALFPCDAGCPASGSFNQMMHNFSGAFGYFLTPPALALIGAHLMANGRTALGGAALAVAALSGVAFAQMLTDLQGAQAGLWQRLADFTPFVWMSAALLSLRKR